MSFILLFSGLTGFSLILSMSRSTSHYKQLVRENDLTLRLSVNMLNMEAAINEFIITGDERKISEYRFRTARSSALLDNAEKIIKAEQMRVIIYDLRHAHNEITTLFQTVINDDFEEDTISQIHGLFSFVKNSLEIATNSMNLISSGVDAEQDATANRSFFSLISLLFAEIAIVIIMGFQFSYSILKPVRNLQLLLGDIFDSMPSILIGVNEEGRVGIWNKSAEQVTGITQQRARGEIFTDVFTFIKEDRDLFRKKIGEQSVFKETGKYSDSDGNEHFLDIIVYPLTSKDSPGAVIRADDVTEKHQLQEHMIQSEKMLSVGGLAAGMAHEINNPLAGLIQTASSLERRLGLNGNLPANIQAAVDSSISLENLSKYLELREIPHMFANINESGKRVSDLVSNMLSFARKEKNKKIPLNIAELIDKTIDLASADYSFKKDFDFRNISIKKYIESDLPELLGEAPKLQQVFFNIFKNGAFAMDRFETKDPCFTISISHIKYKHSILISISDNGPGIPEEIRKRIFEPFFTTKVEGEGTGLGLSLSYFIITEYHDGEMSVSSTEGVGTAFNIQLPV